MKKRNYTVEELINDDSFVSYILDADSPAGREWELRLAEEQELRAKSEEAAQVIRSLKYQDLSFTKDEQRQIWDRINLLTQPERTISPRRNVSVWMKVAAVLIPILVSSLLMIFYVDKKGGKDEVTDFIITKECLDGRKMLVTLPDGSTIKLNSGSQIAYSSNFEKDTRVVWLQGEGFFDVKRNPDKPFVILSGNVRTQVLGTSFNVKSYKDERVVDVTVASGLVSVSRYSAQEPNKLQWDNISGVVLNPDEFVSYDVERDKFSDIVKVDANEVLGWKSGILVFKSAPFDEIVSQLERWYGVEFEVEDSIEIADGFTGKFDNKSLRRVLEGISYTSKFDFHIEGKKVTISKERKMD